MHADPFGADDRPHADPQRHGAGATAWAAAGAGALGIYACRIAARCRLSVCHVWQVAPWGQGGRYPTNQGFDEWYGFPHSTSETLGNIQPGYVAELAPNQGLWEGRVGEPSKRVGDYDYAMRPLMDAEITRRSVDYITAHARDAKPFFLYVPFSLPHAPPLAHPKYRLKDKTDYQNVLHEIDQNAGAILDAIDAAGIRENTIVVFTSDNGPETHVGYYIAYGAMNDTGPFRGEFPSG